MKSFWKREKGLLKAKFSHPFFLSLGFLTHDIYKNRKIIGGASAYSAILARNFGINSAIATSIGKDFKGWNSLTGIHLAYQIGERVTTFINKPFFSGKRIQYVTSVADRIKEETIPDEWFNTEIVYICPVLDELEEEIIKRFNSMVGVAPQGWLRSVDEGGKIEKKRWENANEILSKADFVILSEEDIFEENIAEYVELSNIFVLTRGRKGAELYCDSGKHHEHIPAFEREERDATGAGDAFGAAFLLRYYETRDVVESAVFASCAASFVVEKVGVEGVPHKEEVMERMEKEGGGSFSIK